MSWQQFPDVAADFETAVLNAGQDWQVAYCQIQTESGFDPDAEGPSTAYGTAKGAAQFLDSTWAQFGSGSPYDPQAAAAAYVNYMGYLLGQCGGDYSCALYGYNHSYSGYVNPILACAAAGNAPDVTGQLAAGGGASLSTDLASILPDFSSVPVLGQYLAQVPSWAVVGGIVLLIYFLAAKR